MGIGRVDIYRAWEPDYLRPAIIACAMQLRSERQNREPSWNEPENLSSTAWAVAREMFRHQETQRCDGNIVTYKNISADATFSGVVEISLPVPTNNMASSEQTISEIAASLCRRYREHKKVISLQKPVIAERGDGRADLRKAKSIVHGQVALALATSDNFLCLPWAGTGTTSPAAATYEAPVRKEQPYGVDGRERYYVAGA